ncbi:SsrA-binding protein [Flavobacterium piscinae]|uniref:SsrA-binding protein n=1 Tax=Flavobacterium piscinae TaxID=2506424 RepID=A0A4Q1KFL2_9FLAO|nr:SsrA-binding protein [Flavobacterium piscinae]MBC8882860.1 SsrA-binding protein [Flavobacterium piscinae]RXR28488.1 SsrA-binding protein [Flavobacterium piscinae]
MYTFLSKINKIILPSFTKQQLDLTKAKKWQMAIIGWRYYVTTRALDEKRQ